MKPFPGAAVLADDPRYPALIRGFNQRWVGTPKYVEVCGGDIAQKAVLAPVTATAIGLAINFGRRYYAFTG